MEKVLTEERRMEVVDLEVESSLSFFFDTVEDT